MTQVIVGRWGKNLTVRFPNQVAAALQLHDGDRVEVESQPAQIVIRRVNPRYALDSLLPLRS